MNILTDRYCVLCLKLEMRRPNDRVFRLRRINENAHCLRLWWLIGYACYNSTNSPWQFPVIRKIRSSSVDIYSNIFVWLATRCRWYRGRVITFCFKDCLNISLVWILRLQNRCYNKCIQYSKLGLPSLPSKCFWSVKKIIKSFLNVYI